MDKPLTADDLAQAYADMLMRKVRELETLGDNARRQSRREPTGDRTGEQVA